LIVPEWGGLLRNYYFFIRSTRGVENKFKRAKRRRYYRYIASERRRIIEQGIDAEIVRLYCRWLANTRNEYTRKRFEGYHKNFCLEQVRAAYKLGYHAD